MVIGIHHLGIVTRDPRRSVAFYAHLLGGNSERLAGHTVVTAGGVRIAITEATAADPPGYARGHHVAFGLTAVERPGLIERLGELGAAHEEVRGRLYTRDPDGFTLEFLFTEGRAASSLRPGARPPSASRRTKGASRRRRGPPTTPNSGVSRAMRSPW